MGLVRKMEAPQGPWGHLAKEGVTAFAPALVALRGLVLGQVTCGCGDKAAIGFCICLFIPSFIHSACHSFIQLVTGHLLTPMGCN